MKRVFLLLGIPLFISFTVNAQYTDLTNFNGTSSPQGQTPRGSLTLVGDKLYGMTEKGGTKDSGCIFSENTDGTNYTDLKDLDSATGCLPYGSFTLSNGILYGMTEEGGANGDGNIFSYTIGGGFTDLWDFDGGGDTNGSMPRGNLTLSVTGDTLYGMTMDGGTNGGGNIFRININGSGYKDLWDFENGSNPHGSLTLSGGLLYGVTFAGGEGTGNIFSINADGTNYQDLQDLDYTTGAYPGGDLLLLNGVLYGTSEEGGNDYQGCIFSINTDGSNYNNLYNFTVNEEPTGDLMPSVTGDTLYGTGAGGFSSSSFVFSYGNIFSVPINDTAGTQYLWSFDAGGDTNGSVAYGSLTPSVTKDTVFGMTSAGGTNSDGNVFRFLLKLPVSVTDTATANVSCNGGNNGSALATASAGTSPYTYSWSPNGGTNSTATGLSAGTYTTTVTDNGGSTASATVTITQPNTLSSATASVISNACNGTNNGNASVTLTGGGAPYTYSWSNGTSTVSTSNPTGAILGAGTYTVTVQDNCGASATAAILIQQSSPIIITPSVTSPIVCNGASNGAATAGVTGGVSPYTYSWSSGGGTDADITTYSIPTPDTLSYQQAVQTFTVPAGITQVSITLTGGQGGYGTDNTFIGGNGASFTGVASVIPGHVLGIVTGGEGESGAAESEAGGGGGGSYVWDENTTTLIAVAGGGGGAGWNVTGGGTGGTDLINNTATNGADVSNLNAAGGTGGNGGAAGNANFPGAGGAGWLSNGGSYTSIFGSAEGGDDYTNNFAGGAGADGDANGGYGGGGGGILGGGGGGGYNGGGGGNGSTGGGGGSYFNTAYGALPGNVTTADTGNGSVIITYLTPSGTGLVAGIYTVTVTDNNGCSDTASVTLTQPNALSTTASVIDNACSGADNGNASASPSGGSSPYTYSWSSGQTTSATGDNLSEGTYTVTVQDNCGASATATVSIAQITALSTAASVITDVTCNGGNNGIATANPSDGRIPYTYSWSGNGGTNSTAIGLSAAIYTLTVQDNCGTSATATVTITQPDALTTTASVINNSCPGSNTGNAVASPSGGTTPYTYSWSPVGGTDTTGTGLSAGTFTVTVQDNCGASATASVTITELAALSATASAITNVSCNGGNNGNASASPSNGSSPYTYSWSPSGGTNFTANGLSAGTYTITVSDQCSNSATASVIITEPSAMSIVRDSASDNGSNTGVASVTVNGGTSPYTYSWAPGAETTDTIKGQSAGTYTCTITDNNSCSQTISITIKSSTGIDNISNLSSVNIYPDPTSGSFTISGVSSGQVVNIYNYLGENISNLVTTNNSNLQLNISDQANGVYLIRILNKNGTMVYEQKIVKTN